MAMPGFVSSALVSSMPRERATTARKVRESPAFEADLHSAGGRAIRRPCLQVFLRNRHTDRVFRIDEIAEPDTAALVQALRTTPDGTVVVIGHSDTLPAVMAALGGPADLKFAAGDHGSVFIVTPRPQGAASVLRLAY